MRKPRIFVKTALDNSKNILLSETQTHYLYNGLRLSLGDNVLLFNGMDGEWCGLINTLSKKRCTISLCRKVREQKSNSDLWLLFAPLKRTNMDLLARKATELGVGALGPVFTEHTNVKRINLQRLHSNTIEAAQQCERLTVPKVFDPITLTDLINNWEDDRWLFFCDETGAGAPIIDSLNKHYATGKFAPCAILTGPEGGFAKFELDLISESHNADAVDLGPLTLRAETAALAAISCWQAVLGNWRSK